MKQLRICAIAMILAIGYCVGLIWTASALPEQETAQVLAPDLGYGERIFDTSMVHKIEIQVTEQDWNHLKQNAMSKECIDGTVYLDGEEFCHVGVRTKGNSTLFLSAARGWDRFSLVLEFDAFDQSQRYYGLDTLSLYNNMFDVSYMKSYLCYEMMRSLDVATPLCSFAAVYVNGTYVGLYSASETFSESFALRNFGYDYGNIYKPEHMDISAMITGEVQNAKLNFAGLAEAEGFSIDKLFDVSVENIRLAYSGEELSAYEDIWRNSSFDIGTSDKIRFVDALEQISLGNGEAVVDMDALARYFAANTFVLNTDCYTTGTVHNYGVYEKDGILTMLPWDYDVALGNIGSEFGVSDATTYINLPIDEPVCGTTVEERPMLDVLLSSEEGLALYHSYLDQLLELWIENGRLDAELEALDAMIRPWVEMETTSVYTIEEYDHAVRSIGEYSRYRGESVRGQLEGTIPATADGQAEHPETLVDCSGYTYPESGIMSVLLPDRESDEVTLDAVLEILPSANENLAQTVNLAALINMIDFRSLMSMDLSGMGSGDHSDLDVGAIVESFSPYLWPLLDRYLPWVLVPAVLIFGLWFAKRFGRKKGGVSSVV